MVRRRFFAKRVRQMMVIGLSLSASFPATALAAVSDTYPARPGRLIVPFGTGASTDRIARIYAQTRSEVWGQQLVVENRPGWRGVVGTEVAARATPAACPMLVYGIKQTITR